MADIIILMASGIRTFTNYADYAHAVRTASSRYYNFPNERKLPVEMFLSMIRDN